MTGPLVTKIMFLGDVHADITFMRDAIAFAARNGATSIMQVGDFGIWDHVPAGVDFLDKTNAFLEDAGLWLIFVDGNHENFDSLYAHPFGTDGFRTVRERILHAPRGHTWAVDGLNFLAFGGGSSIDGPDGPSWWPQARGPIRGNDRGGTVTLGDTTTEDYLAAIMHNHGRDLGGWWPQERITDADVAVARELLVHAPPIDIMVTHDCPIGLKIPGITRTYPAGQASRKRVREVMDLARPQLLVCGHYHRRHAGMVRQTRVEMLASNNERKGQLLFVETDPFTVLTELA